MIGDLLGLAAGALAATAWLMFLRMDEAQRDGPEGRPFVVAMATAMVLAVVSLYFPMGLIARVAAWLAVIASGLFIGRHVRLR